MKFFQNLFDKVTLLITSSKFPISSFKEETMDESTLTCEFFDFFRVSLVDDFRPENNIIEWQELLTSSYLHDSRQVRHRVK